MDVAGSLDPLLGSPWVYPAITGVIAAAGVVPPVPSEATLAATAAFGVSGDLDLAAVCAATTAGSLLGDLAAYAVGRRARRPAASGRAAAVLRRLERHGGWWWPVLVLGARFVPGGTTSVGVAAGLVAFPLRRFARWALLGSLVWTGYGLALALLARAAFPDTAWLSLAVPVLVAAGAGGLGWAALRRWSTRRTPTRVTGARGPFRTGRGAASSCVRLARDRRTERQEPA
ncbi:hypothetical protein NUM3379_38770 [Kineococcus sp. NUM-3379]